MIGGTIQNLREHFFFFFATLFRKSMLLDSLLNNSNKMWQFIKNMEYVQERIQVPHSAKYTIKWSVH